MSGQLTEHQIKQKANAMRESIVKMLEHAGSGHSAGPLGLADLVATLYFGVMNIDPAEPDKSDRDLFFLSNGHCVPVQYAAMAEAGYFPKSELITLRQWGSRLQGHPERTKLPGLENTSGPLGCGVAQGAGAAYAFQYLDAQRNRWVYVVTGDGELDEGNIWESAMFAGKYKLSQLIVFVDRNNIQIDGPTESVMPLENLHAKWESFGWHHTFRRTVDLDVVAIDKHDQLRQFVFAGKHRRFPDISLIELAIAGDDVDPAVALCIEILKRVRRTSALRHATAQWPRSVFEAGQFRALRMSLQSRTPLAKCYQLRFWKIPRLCHRRILHWHAVSV
jgi:transketolase